MSNLSTLLIIDFFFIACAQAKYNYRPQFHFSAPQGLQRYPTGAIFYTGKYHIYYEHVGSKNPITKEVVTLKRFPNMSWGHAVSKNLLIWRDLGEAIPHDKDTSVLGGSVALDKYNTGGFRKRGEVDLVFVAMYTLVKLKQFEKGELDFNADNQVQSLAYSTDGGHHFTKLTKPLMENTFRDQHFRDPKLLRYEDYWVAIVAAGDKMRFYWSHNLTSWTYMSQFGVGKGSHGGMWGHPSLFKMKYGAGYKWILLVSIDYQPDRSGGPNGGSATQYFFGNFDGKKFTSSQKETLWLDWGPDYYAAVNFEGLTDGKILATAWMNNLMYAGFAPNISDGWNGQMVLPRELSLINVRGNPRLVSKPTEGIASLKGALVKAPTSLNLKGGQVHSIQLAVKSYQPPLLQVRVTMVTSSVATLCFTNGKHEICVGHERKGNTIFIDRTKSGSHKFVKNGDKFYKKNRAKRETRAEAVNMDVYLDSNSLEVFADDGLVTMTSLVFPDNPFTELQIRQSIMTPTRGPNTLNITKLEITRMYGGVGINVSPQLPGRPRRVACKPPGKVRRFFSILSGEKP